MQNDHYLNLGSTIRACVPDMTLKKLKPILNKIGVTRIANVTGLDHIGIPVAVCMRPNSKHLSVSQGKGVSWELAQVSAIMEAVESYHAENPCEPDLIGTYRVLKSHFELVDPNYLCRGFFKLNEEYHELGWMKGINLINDQLVYVPFDAICLDSSRLRPETAIFNASSNGLAAGNTMTEAILHGLYEVIERDALWHWQQLSEKDKVATQINLDSIRSTMNRELVDQLLTVNMKIKIWDISSTINLPAYYCMIADVDRIRNLGAFTGSGAHLYREVALTRAILEAAQARLTFITGTRDEIFPYFYGTKYLDFSLDDFQSGKLEFNYGDDQLIKTSFEENLNEITRRLQEKNFSQLIVVNHTKSILNIPVVHILVPGMRLG